MTRHKHYDCIIAWANGVEIEFLNQQNKWEYIQFPNWHDNFEYRIKPEPKTDVVLYAVAKSHDDNKKYAYLSPAHSLYYIHKNIESTPNIKLTYDGETNEFKSAEKI